MAASQISLERLALGRGLLTGPSGLAGGWPCSDRGKLATPLSMRGPSRQTIFPDGKAPKLSQGLFRGALSLGLAALLLAPMPAAAAKTVSLDRIVAVVGPRIILESDLRRELSLSPLVAARMAQFTSKPSDAQLQAIREEMRPQVLEALIGDNLVLLEAEKYPSLALSDAELEAYLLNIAKGNQMKSVDDLKREVQASGEYGSWAEYKATMRRQVGVYKIEVSLVPVPDVTETELRAKYRELGKDEQAKVQARRWVFETKSQAQSQVEALQANPKAQGSLVELSPGNSAPAVDDALFSAKSGEVLGPLPVGRQWMVFAVDEVKASSLAPYEDVREQLRQKMDTERRSKATQQYRDTLRANHHIEIRNR